MEKDLLYNAIASIDILLEKGVIVNDEGKQLFGDAQWGNLRQWFKTYGKGAVYLTLQSINKHGTDDMKALRLRCQQAIYQIEQAESDRVLRNQESIENINGIKTAKITAWVAVGISVVALIVSILSKTIWK